MPVEIKVPPLGESVTEATVAKWLKTVGETVAVDEPLVELETDKVTVEVPASVAGIVAEIVAAVGVTVAIGAVLGVITPVGEGKATLDFPLPAPSSVPPATERLSPAVRRMVTEQALTPSIILATGRGGRLTKADVIDFQDPAASVPTPPPLFPPLLVSSYPDQGTSRGIYGKRNDQGSERGPERGEERVRMTRLRQKIAARLKEAQNNAAMLTTFNEVDMTEVTTLRDRHRGVFEQKYNIRLGFMAFFAKACIAGLKAFPAVNAEIDNEEIVYKNYCHIGVAVGTEQGLVVPVVRDADLKSFAVIESEIADLSRRAREGRLTVADLSGGTFTLTNGGIYGSLMSTPILNPPQSGILGMHRILLRPTVMPDGSIVARPMMYVALSYDHRIIDGREAVSFLVRVKECIEDPVRLLLEV